ncbi:MAG: GDSL-type esterase/lipase family protein [Opitutaceae bacterium]
MRATVILGPLKTMNGWRLSAVLLVTGLTCAGAPPPLTIVTFGDSTTAERPGFTVYSQILEQTLPGRLHEPVRVINAGVRGNTTADAAKRFAHDVLAVHPDLVVMQFGINDATIDVWKKPPATEPRVVLADYLANLRRFIAGVRAQGGKVVLMTPNPLRWTPQLVEMYGHPPYNADDPDGLNINLSHYAAAVRELAAQTGVPLVDIWHAYETWQGGAADPLVADGMHPNQRGHELVARLLTQTIIEEQLSSRAPAP